MKESLQHLDDNSLCIFIKNDVNKGTFCKLFHYVQYDYLESHYMESIPGIPEHELAAGVGIA